MDKALDERTIGHNPERLCLMKVLAWHCIPQPRVASLLLWACIAILENPLLGPIVNCFQLIMPVGVHL